MHTIQLRTFIVTRIIGFLLGGLLAGAGHFGAMPLVTGVGVGMMLFVIIDLYAFCRAD